MRLIHCKKCGSATATEDAIVERMQDYVAELNEKARKCKRYADKCSYMQEASSVTKMMKGILHNTAQMQERKITCNCELSEIVNYIRENRLVSDEKLDELRSVARENAKLKNEREQKEIERIYGNFKNRITPFNNTKSDPTTNNALKNYEKTN